MKYWPKLRIVIVLYAIIFTAVTIISIVLSSSLLFLLLLFTVILSTVWYLKKEIRRVWPRISIRCMIF